MRLKYFDYSSFRYYFVTICTYKKKSYLGSIKDGEMVLNEKGRMIRHWWCELENKYPEVQLDEYIIMPNHMHGIINIVGANLRVRPKTKNDNNTQKTDGHISPSPQSIVQWFKTMSTNNYIRNVKNNNWPRFDGYLWHRSFYDHVVRNERSLENIRRCIRCNPGKWGEDIENPQGRNKESVKDHYSKLFSFGAEDKRIQ